MSNTDLSDLLGPNPTPVPVGTSVVRPPEVSAASGGVAYDAANQVDRLATWNPPIRSADADIIPEKMRLDARARDTLRNDAYVSGGATLHKDNIVGARFQLNARPMTKVLFGRDDPVWETEFQEEVEDKFMLWAESPQNWPDASRHNTLTELIRLAVGVHTAGGEVLASGEWMPNDGRLFRTAMLMIDTDRLSTPGTIGMIDKSRIRGGVERDRRGAPVAYYIRNVHPAEGPYYDATRGDQYEWKRIPARKPWGRQMILHIFEQNRPDQSRGISAMVSALTEMRMTKNFRKTELQRAVIAATYAASIESDLPSDAALAMGGTNMAADGNHTVQWMLDYLKAIDAHSGGARNLHMAGAQIPIFAPGTHLKIQNPGAASPSGDKFEASLLRHIAAALGVSYEELSRDYTQTNYSSARAAMGQTWKGMLSLKKRVADTTANFIYRLWLEEAVNYNLLESLKRRNIPAFYEGLNAEAYSNADWVGAGRGQIDPLKETQAAILKIKNGLSTQEHEAAMISGQDWRRIQRQRAREMQLAEDLDLPAGVYADEVDTAQNAVSGTERDE